MPSMFDIKVFGSKTTKRKFKAMADAVEAKAMRSEMKAAMEPVKETAKTLVPVDTGLLRNSIRISVTGGTKRLTAKVTTGTRKQLGIAPNDPYYYPAAVEYGTRTLPARSFLRRAIALRKRQVINSLSRSLRNAILAGGRK